MIEEIQYIYIYIMTPRLITLPCSLVRTGNNNRAVKSHLFRVRLPEK